MNLNEIDKAVLHLHIKIFELLNDCMPSEYANHVLTSEVDGHSFADDVITEVMESSEWQKKHVFFDETVKEAIGKIVTKRLGLKGEEE